MTRVSYKAKTDKENTNLDSFSEELKEKTDPKNLVEILP